MDFIISQLPFIGVLILLVIRVVVGAKRGVIKELIAIPASLIACFAVLFLSFAFRSVFNEAAQVFLGSIVLTALLLILFKLIDIVITGSKPFRKKTEIKPVSRVFGGIVAVVVTIVLVWGVFCITMVMNQGPYSEAILASVRNNVVMRVIYQYNYFYYFASLFSQDLASSFAESMRQINASY